MKDFTDNLKAFATFILGLFKSGVKSGDDENQISAEEFARAHAKKIFALAAVLVIFVTTSFGTSEKFFGGTSDEFVDRYNANLERVISNADFASRLKFAGSTNMKIDELDMEIFSFTTQQNYLAAEFFLPKDFLHDGAVCPLFLKFNDAKIKQFEKELSDRNEPRLVTVRKLDFTVSVGRVYDLANPWYSNSCAT